MCEKCSRDEYEVEFEGNSKSILCKQCFYDLFKDLIPGLKVPIDYKRSVEYKHEVLFASAGWKDRKEALKYSISEGKWGNIFIYTFDENYGK